MDKRTTDRMAKLASRVLRTGKCTATEAKRLAACALSQVAAVRAAKKKPTKKKR